MQLVGEPGSLLDPREERREGLLQPLDPVPRSPQKKGEPPAQWDELQLHEGCHPDLRV